MEYDEYDDTGDTIETHAQDDGYDESTWKTFQREESEAEPSQYQYIDDIDSGGQQGGVDL